ncbi:dynamin family protein [Salinifilum ghardaiensis]
MTSPDVAFTAALPQQVQQTRDRLFTLLRDTAPDVAAWVDDLRRARPDKPTVVVVGETNRGKSSLVNALLGHDGLSSADAGGATATHLWFERGERWQAHACYPGQEPVPVDFDALADWTVVAPDTAGHVPPRRVRVRAPLPALDEITVVDTPGVGGLRAEHGELALEAAGSATALLFVSDASAPITCGELEFLNTVAARVETVLFALTKTDRHRGWREIREENRRLLAEHAPRFAHAPIHPVSARMLHQAEAAPHEHARELLRGKSGIGELSTAVRAAITDRSAMLGEANTLRALSTVLGELIGRWEAEHRALTCGEHEAESLRSRRDELQAARRSSTRGWQVRLRGEIQRARAEIGHEVANQVRQVQTRFRRAIDAADRAELAELPAQADSALQLVASRTASLLSGRLAGAAERSLAELFSAEELDVIRSQFARGAHPPVTLRTPDKRPPTAEDKLLVVMGISSGLGLGRVAVALPWLGLGAGTLTPVVLPVSIALGLGAGWWMARTRRHAADKQHLKQWLTEAITDARSALDQLVAEQLIEAEQQLLLALDDVLTRRIEAIDEELREVDRALRMDAAERGRQAREIKQRVDQARSGREKAEHLLAGIRNLRDGHEAALRAGAPAPDGGQDGAAPDGEQDAPAGSAAPVRGGADAPGA